MEADLGHIISFFYRVR